MGNIRFFVTGKYQRVVMATCVVMIFSCSCDRLKKSKLKSIFGSSTSPEQGKERPSSNKTTATYAYFEVKKGTLKDEVVMEGKLEATEKVEIKAPQRIRVLPTKFKANQPVKRGDVLFVVDTKDLEQKRQQASDRVAQLKVDIKNSKAQFEFASKQFKRKKSLFQKGIASRKELDEAEKAFVAAESDVQTKELELKKGERELKTAAESVVGANIVSPMDGYIASIVPGDSEINQGQTLALIQNPKQLSVVVPVAERIVTKLSTGQKIQVQADAVNDQKIDGVIRDIETKAGSSGTLQNSYFITVDINQKTVKDLGLKDGYSATVSVLFKETKNAIIIPRSCIRKNGADNFVLVAPSKGATPAARSVKLGTVNELEAEILSGLTEKEIVASAIDGEESKS